MKTEKPWAEMYRVGAAITCFHYRDIFHISEDKKKHTLAGCFILSLDPLLLGDRVYTLDQKMQQLHADYCTSVDKIGPLTRNNIVQYTILIKQHVDGDACRYTEHRKRNPYAALVSVLVRMTYCFSRIESLRGHQLELFCGGGQTITY